MPIIAAWDIGQSTGFAVGPPGRAPLFGTIRLPAVTNPEHYGRRLDAFMKWGDDFLSVHKPTELFIEAPFAAQRRTGADLTHYIRAQFVYAGLAELLCYRRSIRIWEARVGDVRKFFRDDGHATDTDVLVACHARGWQPADSHQADALALWDFAVVDQLGLARAA